MKLNRRQLRRMIIEQSKAAVSTSPYKKANDLLLQAGNEYGRVGQSSEFYSDLGSLLLSLKELIDMTDNLDENNPVTDMVADMARKAEKQVEVEESASASDAGPRAQDMR